MVPDDSRSNLLLGVQPARLSVYCGYFDDGAKPAEQKVVLVCDSVPKRIRIRHCVYQYGMLFVTGAFGVGTVFAILFTIAILVMLFRPDPYKKQERMMKGRAFAAA